MTGLLSLPNGLLTEIYIFAGQQTRALVRLSAVNRRLRAIWIRESDLITASAIQLKAPNHSDATFLTLLEARCPVPVTGFHTLDESYQGPPLRLCLPQLMRNIGLASAICSRAPLWSARVHDWDHRAYAMEPVYYLVRKFTVAFHYPTLRQPLYTALQALPAGSLLDYERICSFLTSLKPEARTAAHHLMKPISQFTQADYISTEPEGDLIVLADMWDFAVDVGWKLIFDRADDRPEDPDAYFHPFGGRKEGDT